MGKYISVDILFIFYSPVYEVPLGFYTGEQILKILLNPHIDKKICHSKPCNVSQSSTFVVDLESLQHLDDIKKTVLENGSIVADILFHMQHINLSTSWSLNA